MRRWVPLISLALFLGLLTSVAIAWLGAALNRETWPDVPLTRGTVERAAVVDGWLVDETSDATCTRRLINLWSESPVPPYLEFETLPSADKPAISRGSIVRTRKADPADHRLINLKARVWEREAGWPMRCLSAHHAVADHRVAFPGEYVRGGLHVAAWEWPWSHTAHQRKQPEKPYHWLQPRWESVELDHALPLTPMWLGLFANSLVFGSAWAIVMMPAILPGLLRMRWRRRRDRCTRCGYPLSGADICPECGKPRVQRQPLTGVLPMVVGTLAVLLLASGLAYFAHRQWSARPMLPPLHHAAATGNLHDIGLLLAAGKNVNEGVDNIPGVELQMSGSTPLSWAAGRGKTDATAALLKAGASPDGVGGNSGMNFDPAPVALAARANDAQMCKLLLDAGASPLHRRDRFSLALTDALDWGDTDPEIVALILMHTPTGKAPDPLPREIRVQPEPVFTLLLEHFDWDQTQLFDIIKYQIDDDRVMQAVIAKGLSIEEKIGRDLLGQAIKLDVIRASIYNPVHGAPQTRAALELGISPQRHAELWPLREALPLEDTIRALLEAGADPIARGHGRATLLHELSQQSGLVEVMHLLLEAGVPVDALDYRGRTPLHQAVVYCRAELVEALLAAGANPMARDDQGLLPRQIKPSMPHSEEADRIATMLERAEAEWEPEK